MTTATGPNFRWWNSVTDPTHFLEHDWENPSRAWATVQAIDAAHAGDGSLLEVGPGSGVDYGRHFQQHVHAGTLAYSGVEGSSTLCDDLQRRFPEASWHQLTLADLPSASADVVYARHVMEHQPALEPALGQLLGAARHVVVLTWYRPPGPVAFFELWEGIHCQTFKRADVMAAVSTAGWRITRQQTFASGDEAWVLKRQ